MQRYIVEERHASYELLENGKLPFFQVEKISQKKKIEL